MILTGEAAVIQDNLLLVIVFFFCSTVILWKCKKQHTISCSSTEAEYMYMTDTCCELTWLLNIFKTFGYFNLTLVSLICDSKFALYIAFNTFKLTVIWFVKSFNLESFKLLMLPPTFNQLQHVHQVFVFSFPTIFVLQVGQYVSYSQLAGDVNNILKMSD